MTTETTTTGNAGTPDLQKNLDAFLDLVHKAAEDKGYCGQYEDVLRAAAEANPDKLEYVEAPVVKTVSADTSYRVTFTAGQDPEVEFKAWCETNGKNYVAYVRLYSDRKGEYHTKYGDPTDECKALVTSRQTLLREWYKSLADAGDARVGSSNTRYVEDPAEVQGEKSGRGRLVCKTAQA